MKLDPSIAEDNLRVNLAFSMALAEMATDFIPELRVRSVIYFARPLTFSYECEGKLCEEFMHRLHRYFETDYTVTVNVKGKRYTFSLHKKLRL